MKGNCSFKKSSKFEIQKRHCVGLHSPVLVKNRQHYWQVCSRRAPFFQRPFLYRPSQNSLNNHVIVSWIFYLIAWTLKLQMHCEISEKLRELQWMDHFPYNMFQRLKFLVSGNATLTSQFYVSILNFADEVYCICSMNVLGYF